jgi:hypothetical protein
MTSPSREALSGEREIVRRKARRVQRAGARVPPASRQALAADAEVNGLPPRS